MEKLTMTWHPGKGSYCMFDGRTYYLQSSGVSVFNEDGVICTKHRVQASHSMEPLVFSVPSVKVRNKENFADEAFLLRSQGGYMLYVNAKFVGLSEPEYKKQGMSIVMHRHATNPSLDFETVVKSFVDEQIAFAKEAESAFLHLRAVAPVSYELTPHLEGLDGFDAAAAKLRRVCADAMDFSRKVENYTVQDYLKELTGADAITCERDAIKAAFRVILDYGYSIEPYTEEGRGECGFELENWTDGGVDMPIVMDLRLCRSNPYDPADILMVLQNFAENFDIDDEIKVHREGKDYKMVFSISESVEDFTDWLEGFEKMVNAVEVALGPYFGLRERGRLPENEELENGTYAAILQELLT